MISSLSNYCIEFDCNEYRWSGCDDNLCPLHCRISELEKKLNGIKEIANKRINECHAHMYCDCHVVMNEIERLSKID